MLKLLLIAGCVIIILLILWLLFGDAVEIYHFGEFIGTFIMFAAVCAIIGFIIGIFAKNSFKGMFIGSIIGSALFVCYCILFAWGSYSDKKLSQQRLQDIENLREENRNILSQNWKCPYCGKVNDSDLNSCSNVFMRFYENGKLMEQYFDRVQGYCLFFDRENYEKYVYLKTCIGWRCDVCGSVNAGGFTCKNCGVKRGILSSHYSEYIKNVDERSHIRNEYYPDGEVKTETVYDD